MKIQQLHSDSINRICASQVIPSLHSCIRELIENALDASAEGISVRVRNRGDEIEVADSGSGINEADWAQVCMAHSTSKIGAYDDIVSDSLLTHGFRGEALSAMCALSTSMRIVTRTAAMDAGRVLKFSKMGQLIESDEAVSKSVGTTVTLYGLYQESLPVRYREMQSTMKREMKTIHHLVNEFAIINHDRKFELLVDGKCIVNSAGSESAYGVYKRLINSDGLVEFECRDDKVGVTVTGWIPPTVPSPLSFSSTVQSRGVSNELGQFMFINGHPMNVNKRLVKAMAAVYGKFNLQRLNFILKISLANDRLFDRNASVDKRSVVFVSDIEDALVDLVTRTLEDKFNQHTKENIKKVNVVEFRSTTLVPVGVKAVEPTEDAPPTIPVPQKRPHSESASLDEWSPPPSRMIKRVFVNRTPMVEAEPVVEEDRSRSPMTVEPVGNLMETQLPTELTIPMSFHKCMFSSMDIIGQFNNGFIITKIGTSDTQLFLVDQHAAHEKFLFESYYRNIKVNFQLLISPIQLRLSPSVEGTVVEHLDELAVNGFRLVHTPTEHPGNRIKVLTLPTLSGIGFNRSSALTVADLLEVVDKVGEHDCSEPVEESRLLKLLSSVRAMFASKACRTAVMVGDSLTRNRMSEIVSGLSTLDQPWNCPHGRPTLKHLLSTDDLRKLV